MGIAATAIGDTPIGTTVGKPERFSISVHHARGLPGLVPSVWAHGPGADVMRRIAAPMIGGVITSSLLTLEIVPAIYSLWRGRSVTWVRDEPHIEQPQPIALTEKGD